jgi:hypothetical protein
MFDIIFAGEKHSVAYEQGGFLVQPKSKGLEDVLKVTMDRIASTEFFFDANAVEHYVALELGVDAPLIIEPAEEGLIY